MPDVPFRVFTDKKVMSAKEEFFDVELYTKDMKEVEEGKGYLKDDYVYVYRGRVGNYNRDLPTGLYKIDKKLEFVTNDKDKDAYHIDNIIELNPARMFDEISKKSGDFVDPKDVEIINNNSEFFKPTINHDDDVWKYIIKRIILEKQINLKNYRDLFDSVYTLNNMRSALERSTKMTVKNFIAWCEILGVDWEITIKDNGEDKYSPLPEDFTVTNYDRW